MTTYSIHGYGRMIADRVRHESYAEALRRSVTPGAVVVEIGTGTGTYAFLACQLGAGRVYAIEPSDAIHLGRAIAEANGFADRIEFIQGLSTEIELPEQADVVVSDLRSTTPLHGDHLRSIVDARRRFLVPGGVFIPTRDVVHVGVATAAELYGSIVDAWEKNPLGLDMGLARDRMVNSFTHGSIDPAGLAAEPAEWATIDYSTVEDTGFAGRVSMTATRTGPAHGLALWFTATLVDGVGFSTGPDEPDMVYNRPFLPWSEPVALMAGDVVHVELRADRAGADYVWSWRTKVVDGDGGTPKAEFVQSTFNSMPISPRYLRHRREAYVAELAPTGHTAMLILQSMAAGRALGDIADELVAQSPSTYATRDDALARVAAVADRYAR